MIFKRLPALSTCDATQKQGSGPSLLCINTQFKFKERTFGLAKKITKRRCFSTTSSYILC